MGKTDNMCGLAFLTKLCHVGFEAKAPDDIKELLCPGVLLHTSILLQEWNFKIVEGGWTKAGFMFLGQNTLLLSYKCYP